MLALIIAARDFGSSSVKIGIAATMAVSMLTNMTKMPNIASGRLKDSDGMMKKLIAAINMLYMDVLRVPSRSEKPMTINSPMTSATAMTMVIVPRAVKTRPKASSIHNP